MPNTDFVIEDCADPPSLGYGATSPLERRSLPKALLETTARSAGILTGRGPAEDVIVPKLRWGRPTDLEDAMDERTDDCALDFVAEKSENHTAMATPALSEIESDFARLWPEAQLSLLERLVHRVRVAVSRCRDTWEADLSAMAADPKMQRELNRISVAKFSSST